MDLKKISGVIDKLKLVQGIERDLLKYKRKSTIGAIFGGIVVIFGFLSQMLKPILDILDKGIKKEIFEKFSGHILIGTILLIIGFIVFWLSKRTSLLYKESEEPFRYSFWIEPFKRIKIDPEDSFIGIKNSDKFHQGDNKFLNLLHHDLMERLNDRVKRLSVLDIDELKKVDTAVQQRLTSHIHIEGNYTLREYRKGIFIHVIPRVRIGPSSNPITLANAIKYRISKKEEDLKISSVLYNQIVERIYSSVASEIYKQINLDVKKKLQLFPTAYTRAAALYHEARDFARSNTLDAYDQAIELYRESLRFFNISEIKWLKNILMRLPFFRSRKIKSIHLNARMIIGYSQCLIYRRVISACSGRYLNPIFEIPAMLNKTINELIKIQNRMNKRWKLKNLTCEYRINKIQNSSKNFNKKIKSENELSEAKKINRKNATMAFLTFPKDNWFRVIFRRTLQTSFQRQRHILFDAFTVAALSYYFLGAYKIAQEYLEDARSIAPQRSERNALFQFTAGSIEPDLDKEILLFKNAVENAPDFEMALFSLSRYSEMRFRRDLDISEAKAESILEKYLQVLKFNPGNIAALAAQGYIYWLLGGEKNLNEAEDLFIEGCNIKAIVHSHPDSDATPSPHDTKVCNFLKIPYLIVSFPGKDMKFIEPNA